MSTAGCPDENDLLAFVECGGTGTVADHLVDCAHCRHLVALLGAPAEQEPQTLGRYELDRVIGRGGMGVVYSGLDPRLDRRVALKTLRLRGTDSAPESGLLKREAAAMAKLSHPNVVQVFDVGREGSTLYIAMELVDGMSLSEWILGDRTWRARLGMLEQIARGVEAAHAAGVLHRDLKPSNVLVRTDGRAMVADFGIAGRVSERLPTVQSLSSGAPGDPAASDDATLTLRGAGTVPYMAPEQHDGAASDVATDVYALCAMAYEVMFGVRPFPANTSQAKAAKLAGRVAPPRIEVPLSWGWVRPVLLRGMEPKPSDRWQRVGHVREALTRGIGRRQRWSTWGSGLALGALAVGGLAWGAASPASGADCGEADRIEDAWKVAAPTLDEVILADVSGPRSAAAAETRTRVSGFIDDWTTRWREVCAVDDMGAERACLRRHQGVVDGLLEALNDPSPKLGLGLERATAGLQPIESCFEQPAAGQGPPPVGSRELSRISLLLELGENAKARTLLDAAVHGDPVGHEGPLWDYIEMRLAYDDGRYTDVISIGQRAYLDAVGENLDEDGAMVALLVAQALSVAGRGIEAKPWLRHAEAGFGRAAVDVDGRADYHQTALLVSQAVRDLEGAARHGERAVALLGTADPVVVTALGSALNDLANVRIMLGEYAKAEATAARGAQLLVDAYGEEHRTALMLRATVANLQLRSGEMDEAIRTLREVDTVLRRAPDENKALRRLVRMNYATAELKLENWNEGRTLLLEVLPELQSDPSAVEAYASALNNLAAAEIELGELDSAESRFNRLLAIHRERSGDDSLEVAAAHSQLGAVALADGRLDIARQRYEKAIRWFDANLPAHGSLSYALVGLADVEVAAGQPELALPLLRRGLDIRNEGGFSPPQIEEIQQKIKAARAAESPVE